MDRLGEIRGTVAYLMVTNCRDSTYLMQNRSTRVSEITALISDNY
jgi:hypothetical protein